ncbi:MAG: helix-turn-helix domain-containing protein [Alphaproteobacteria bacterium]
MAGSAPDKLRRLPDAAVRKVGSLPIAIDCDVPDAARCAACPVRRLSFCAVFDRDELNLLDRISGDRHSEAGSALFHEGDEATRIYVVRDGCLRLYRLLPDGRRQIIGFGLPGDFLGLASRDGYAYTAEAVVDSKVCWMRRRDADDLQARHPKLSRKLLEMSEEEHVRDHEHMLTLGRRAPQERVAAFLLQHLARHVRRFGRDDDRLVLEMTRLDIADYLGLTIETVSRTFTRLRSQGLITLARSHEVRLNDQQALRDLVGLD